MKINPSVSWPTQPTQTTLKVIADTGAQTCTTGTDVLAQLTNSKHWLLATTHRLRGVGNNILDIAGALIVDIHCSTGKTTEVMYICNGVKGTYLSFAALKNLNGSDFYLEYKSFAKISSVHYVILKA